MSTQPGSTGESEVIGVIGGQLKGRFLRKPYTLVFTPDQTILAKRTSALQKETVAAARSETKQRGGGWLSQVRNQMGAHAQFHERYYSMTLDEILAEHEKNQAIRNLDVRSVSLRDPRTVYDDDGTYTTYEARLTIDTPRKKYTFDVDDTFSKKEVLGLLREVYGHRVK